MAESRDVRQQVERFIEQTQNEIVEASRQLARGISRPISTDIEQLVDEVFDFAERVIKSQRRMVSDVVKAMNEQTDRAHA